MLVNGCREVWIERDGRLELREGAFESESQLLDVVERILGPLGRRVDELSPIADGRLPDGSRVNVIIPPLAIDGVTISIRRFRGLRPGPEELVSRGSVPAELMEMLSADVAARRNILISGGTGSGKTTLLNAISSFIEPSERVITIEDAAELRLCQPHVVRLESRPPGIEGTGAVTIRDLVRNALRMRPDRLIIGEVRGPEAMDLVVALNTGHRGALSTVHANGPADALRRLEMLALMSGVRVGPEVIREQLTGRPRPDRPDRAPARRLPRRRVALGGGADGRRRRGPRALGARVGGGGVSPAVAALIAGAGGAALALAAAELLSGVPAVRRYLGSAAAAFQRTKREGSFPSVVERRRLGVVTGAVLALLTLTVAGFGPAVAIALLGPWVAGRLISRGARRYREGLEDAVPDLARGLAAALGSGGSLRRALADLAPTLEGPAAIELGRVCADVELGVPPRQALAAMAARVRLGGGPRADRRARLPRSAPAATWSRCCAGSATRPRAGSGSGPRHVRRRRRRA